MSVLLLEGEIVRRKYNKYQCQCSKLVQSSTWRMIALEPLCRFSSKENFHEPIFFWENCFRRVSVRNLLEWSRPACKNSDVKNRCFFSWHRIGNILRTKYCACCCEGSGGRSTSKNSKEKSASKILIFRDPFSTVFIKQKQLTKHNYTIDWEEKLSFCQVTHEILLVTG